MLAHMLPLRHNFEIAWIIIVDISIDMMDHFFRCQCAPDFCFRDDSMLVSSIQFPIGLSVAAPTLQIATQISAFSRYSGIKRLPVGCFPDARF